MCRPSCCKPSGDGAGIAAVAVIAGGAFVYAKIGRAVARIWHLAMEALAIFMLTAASAVVAIMVTWAMARVIRSRRAHRQTLPYRIEPATLHDTVQADSEPGCLACGGTGMVLRAITASDYRSDRCRSATWPNGPGEGSCRRCRRVITATTPIRPTGYSRRCITARPG